MDIEEDINRYNELKKNKGIFASIDPDFFFNFTDKILADRERIIEDKEIQEDNYQMLSEDVSNIAKELELEEDAIIDEIITKIRILKSKRISMFEKLDCIDKVKKYDSLVENIKEEIADLEVPILIYGGRGYGRTYAEAEKEAKKYILKHILELLDEIEGE